MHIVIVGGGAAGTSAALELRKRLRDADITLLEGESYPEYSPCALPFVIEGAIESFDDIVVHDPSFYASVANIDLRLDTAVVSIDTAKKVVHTATGPFPYDVLVLATGSAPFHPPIPGLPGPGEGKKTFFLKTMDDAKMIAGALEGSTRALVIGAGLVGMEAAVAMHCRGLSVTVMEALPSVLPQMLDPDMSRIVSESLAREGIDIRLGVPVLSYGEREGGVEVHTSSDVERYDLCVVACGVRAQASLAAAAGLAVNGGIVVDTQMRTSARDVYACGDCVLSTCAVTHAPILGQLGSSAVRQARVLAAAVSGYPDTYPATYNTAITKLGPIQAGSAGVTVAQAERAGLSVLSYRFKGSTLPEYYPGGETILIKLVYNEGGRILGGQVVGSSGVLCRINMLSVALQQGADLAFLAGMETAYTPPLSPTVDPLCRAAEMALRKEESRRRARS